jgi:hyperosmotically inducible protein
MKTSPQKLLIAIVAVFLINAPVAFANETDDRIESAAKDSYVFKHYLKDDSVNVSSKDGLVTLTGTVNESNHKTLAQDTVAGLPGVKNVENKLDVKGGENASEGSDTWLALKVKTALLFHRNVNTFKTNVNVNNGVATLTGEAVNQAQMDLTTEYAKDVDGIKEVKNEMTVADNSKMAANGTNGKDDYKANADKEDKDADEHVDDASITAQAKMALLFHRSTSALSTKVETNDGVVTLTGKAKNGAEKDLATKLVKDIRGVKDVVNKMEMVGDNK